MGFILRPLQRPRSWHRVVALGASGSTEELPEGGYQLRLEALAALASRRTPEGTWTEAQPLESASQHQLVRTLSEWARPRETCVLLGHDWPRLAGLTGLMELLPEAQWELQWAVITGPPWIVSWRRGQQRLLMLDVQNYWRHNLESLGRWARGESRFELEAPEGPPGWLELAHQDAANVLAVVQAWWNRVAESELGPTAYTMAGQAWSAYRYRFLEHDVYIHRNDEGLELEGLAHRGGRVECLRLGRYEGEWALLDIQSSYLWCMSLHEYPTRLLGVYRGGSPEELLEVLMAHCVIAEVDLHTDEPAYPAIHEDTLLWPTGRFRAVLTTRELRHALIHGRVSRVHRFAAYLQQPLFQQWAKAAWSWRCQAQDEGDRIYESAAKRMATGLYGRWGQRMTDWQTVGPASDGRVGVWEILDAETGEVTVYRQLAGQVQLQVDLGYARAAAPAVAGHITADCRMELWRHAQAAGLDHVWYLGTDCLWIDRVGEARLQEEIRPRTLGALRVQDRCRYLTIHGLGDHSTERSTRTVGLRPGAIEVRPGVFQQEVWSTYEGQMRRGLTGPPRGRLSTYRRRGQYTRGRVLEDGQVVPWHLELEA